MPAASDRLKKNLWFGYFCFMVFWAFEAYAEIFRYFREGTLFTRILGGHPYISDTVQWYNAAVLAQKCAGGKFNIYDPVVQDQSMRAITAPVMPETYLYLQYPPQFFPFVLPFSLLALTPAYFVWCGIALVLICLALWRLVEVSLKTGSSKLFAAVAVLMSFPSWISFELGQTSLYQFPATVAFWLLLRSQRYFLAGLLSSVLMIKLQYAPVFIIAGIIVGRLRYCSGLLVSAVIMAVATLLTVGWQNVLNFPQALVYGETSTKVAGVTPEAMQNFRGEIVLLAGGDTKVIHLATLAIFAAGLALIGFLWFKLYPRLQKAIGTNAFGVLAGITILLSIIISPHTHIQEFLPAGAAAIFLYPLLETGKNTRSNRALSVCLVGYPFLTWVFFMLMFIFHLIRVQPFFVWSIVTLLLSANILKGALMETAGNAGVSTVTDEPAPGEF